MVDTLPLAAHAFKEQVQMSLPWYECVMRVRTTLQQETVQSRLAKSKMDDMFKDIWKVALKTYPKLSFYQLIKSEMGYEPYLDIFDHSDKRCVAKLRASNHRLNSEIGRYIPSKSSA